MPVHDLLRVLPGLMDDRVALDLASKEDFDLMKADARVMKLIDQSGRAHLNSKTRFFLNFTREIVRQRCPHFDTAARGTEQGAAPICPGIHQKQAVLVNNHCPCCQTHRF